MPNYGLTRACTIGSILDALDRAGGSVTRVFRQADLSPRLVEDPDRLILLKDQFALLEATAREIGDAGVAAQLSVAAGIDGLGAYGYLVASQPTLREALRTARAMLPVMLQTATTVGLTIDGKWAHWHYTVDDAVAVGRRQNDLLCTGYVLDVFRRFCGSGWVPHRCAVAGAPIEGRAAIEATFGCTLSHGGTTTLTFPVEMLDCCNPAPLTPRSFDALPATSDPPALVASAIASGLCEDRPDLIRTARRLGLAPRTLQRRLQEHGTTFEKVLDSTLADRALVLLAAPGPRPPSLTAIAYDLGFAGPSHFTRAFRRWTGSTPSTWRRATRGAQGQARLGRRPSIASGPANSGPREDRMTTLPFDDCNIEWGTLEGFDHVWYYICDVDERNRSADLILKFAANQKIAPHRHMAAYRTLVLQGELRIYRLNGELKEVRPVGSYIESAAGGEPHSEGGGDQDTIVFFSNRNVDGVIYEILGPDGEVVVTFGLEEFRALRTAQRPLPSTLVAAA